MSLFERAPSARDRAVFLLFYGLRLWAAVCLALYVAFWLELDNPFWAGTSAAIVCQPVLGASLRKGWFRMIGTLIGGVSIVLLTMAFPQNRTAFLVGLALWCALCGFVASLLRNFASYAAALAGYTAAIVAGDQLGAVGGVNGLAFELALTRVSEICLGIVCAGLVLATTDFGEARHRLAALLAENGSAALRGVLRALQLPPARQPDSRAERRGMIQRAAGLDTIIDQVLGEESALRFRPRPLQAALDGLFRALSAWRIVALHLEHSPETTVQRDSQVVFGQLPQELTVAPNLRDWLRAPAQLQATFLAAARHLIGMPASTPSLRLLSDCVAEIFLGLRHTAAAIALLQNPRAADRRRQWARLRVPDWLPPMVNAVRTFLTIGIAALVWIVTAWPGGATALVFAAVTVTLFSPRAEQAYTMAESFLLGTAITAALAWLVGFFILPHLEGYLPFCLALGLVLVPGGALSAGNWAQPVFVALTANFVPLLGPANPMSYDVAQFYNTALALLGGVGIAMLALQIIPPIPPLVRAERLLLLTLHDLRLLATDRRQWSTVEWEGHVYGRLTAIPEQVDPLHGARLVAALSVGTEVIRLRRLVQRLDPAAAFGSAMTALGHGRSDAAIVELRRFDAELGSGSDEQILRLRAQGAARVMSEALAQHRAYFDAQPA